MSNMLLPASLILPYLVYYFISLLTVHLNSLICYYSYTVAGLGRNSTPWLKYTLKKQTSSAELDRQHKYCGWLHKSLPETITNNHKKNTNKNPQNEQNNNSNGMKARRQERKDTKTKYYTSSCLSCVGKVPFWYRTLWNSCDNVALKCHNMSVWYQSNPPSLLITSCSLVVSVLDEEEWVVHMLNIQQCQHFRLLFLTKFLFLRMYCFNIIVCLCQSVFLPVWTISHA